MQSRTVISNWVHLALFVAVGCAVICPSANAFDNGSAPEVQIDLDVAIAPLDPYTLEQVSCGKNLSAGKYIDLAQASNLHPNWLSWHAELVARYRALHKAIAGDLPLSKKVRISVDGNGVEQGHSWEHWYPSALTRDSTLQHELAHHVFDSILTSARNSGVWRPDEKVELLVFFSEAVADMATYMTIGKWTLDRDFSVPIAIRLRNVSMYAAVIRDNKAHSKKTSCTKGQKPLELTEDLRTVASDHYVGLALNALIFEASKELQIDDMFSSWTAAIIEASRHRDRYLAVREQSSMPPSSRVVTYVLNPLKVFELLEAGFTPSQKKTFEELRIRRGWNDLTVRRLLKTWYQDSSTDLSTIGGRGILHTRYTIEDAR